MTKKGTIKSIEPNGLWNGLTKYRVTFADGNRYTFFAKGDFKFLVGDKLRYEVTNEEYKNARVPKEEYNHEDFKKKPKDLKVKSLLDTPKRTSLIDVEYSSVKPTNPKDEQIKLKCILAAANFNQLKNVDAETVIKEAQQFFKYIKQ